MHPAAKGLYECDPARIRSSLANLTTNAIRWTSSTDTGGPLIASNKTRSSIVLGSSLAPPHLWGRTDWELCRQQLGDRMAARLRGIVTAASESEDERGTRSVSGTGSLSGESATRSAGRRRVVPKSKYALSTISAGALRQGRRSSSRSIFMSDAVGGREIDTAVRFGECPAAAGLSSPGTALSSSILWPQRSKAATETDKPKMAAAPGVCETLQAAQQPLSTAAQIAPDSVFWYDRMAADLAHDGGRAQLPTVLHEHTSHDASRAGDTIAARSEGPGLSRVHSGAGSATSSRHSTSLDEPDDDAVDVCLWVCDQGPGIRKHDWNQVFVPLQALHSGILTPEGQGSGLGLAITATVMRMHGGCVGFSSKPGLGTVFFLWAKMRFKQPPSDPRRAGRPMPQLAKGASTTATHAG